MNEAGDADATRAQTETCDQCHGRGYVPIERACASETCGNTFRWQDGDGGPGARTDPIYCSRSCARAQAQRAYRRRLA